MAVYPGSFDPPTLGHLDIMRRASSIFPNLTIAVVKNPKKQTLFSLAERQSMIRDMLQAEGMEHVAVDQFEGLLVKYMQRSGKRVIIRGLRATSDFEYEFSFAAMNRTLDKNVEAVYLMANESYTFVSSNLVKEVVRLGGDLRQHVHPLIYPKLLERLGLSDSASS